MRNHLLLLILTAFFFSMPACLNASIQVDSVKTISSSCLNNGSITVFASTNTSTLNYSIVTGPVTRTQQSNNTFNSLPAGTYTVKIMNEMLEFVTNVVTVTGNYIQPNFNPIKINPNCFGTADGKLIGNMAVGTGAAPYSWQIISPAQVTTPAQTSDTFTNLPAGTYAIRVTDACGSYLTYVAELFNPTTNLLLGGIYAEVIGCDTVLVSSRLYSLTENKIKLPLRFTYKTKNGIFIPPPDSINLDTSRINVNPNGSLIAKQMLYGITYGDTIITSIYNACGDSVITISPLPGFTLRPSYTITNCGSQVKAVFEYAPVGNRYGLKAPLRYVFADSSTGAIIETRTIVRDSLYSLSTIINSVTVNASLLSDNTYSLSVMDGCGKTFNGYFRTPVVETPGIVSKTLLNSACIDSMAGSVRIQIKGFNGATRLILLSGPATTGSSKPGYAYQHTHNFPDTILANVTQQAFYLLNVAAGVWHYKIEDNCGNILNDSLVIKSADVTNLKKSVSYRKGCPGNNTILYSLSHANFDNARTYAASISIKRLSDGVVLKDQYYYVNSFSDSLTGLTPDRYLVAFTYRNESVGAYIGPVNGCTVQHDTITIDNYQSPAILLSSNSISCNNSINIELLPDSVKGIPPYQYEIINGPLTFPIQPSNIFTVSSRGIYTARIYDACGNASTTSVFADTVSFSPIGKAKINCNSMSYFYTSSHQYSYSWISHGNNVHIGDTLIINPITPSDTGIYQVTKVVNVNGCRDTFYTAFTVDLPGRVNRFATICEGDSIQFERNYYSHSGIYPDSFIAVDGCDSVVLLYLTVTPYQRDTFFVSICEGNDYLFGGQYYNISGFYHDTIATTQCKSIATLQLNVNPYKRDSLYVELCNGQSYRVGNHFYTQSGIYQDTINTLQCDSIVWLQLRVNDYKRDTLHISICENQSITVGRNIYHSAGVYSDTLSTIGCDSIITLYLTVLPVKRDTIVVNICEGQRFEIGNNSYSSPGTYIDTTGTLECDSIVVVQLTVNPYKRDTIDVSICEGQSYFIGANAYSSSGVYTDTIVTNNCDSIVTLMLTVHPYKRKTLNIHICEGEQFTVGTHHYFTSGVYSDTLLTNTCDSIVTLNLAVTIVKRDTLHISLCNGQQFQVGNHTYSQPGIYSDTIGTVNCDSIVLLYLSFADYKRTTRYITICELENYSQGTNVYSAPGIYSDTFSTTGCDSIVTLHLTVNSPTRDTIYATICEGQTYAVGTSEYSSSGIYSDTFRTAGCDSIVWLNLIVNPYKRNSLDITICEDQVFTFGLNSYSASGTYTDTLSTSSCDSIVTVHLNVLPFKRDSLWVSICEGQQFSIGSHNYSISGSYIDTLPTNGCDSIVTIFLNVNLIKRDTLYVSICEGESFSVGTNVYSSTGIYSDTLSGFGCDSIVLLHLTVRPYKRNTVHITLCEGQSYTIGSVSYKEAGIYMDTLSTSSCDSILTINLSFNPYKTSNIIAHICEGNQYLFNNQYLSLPGTYYDTLLTISCDSIVILTLSVSDYIRGDTIEQNICSGETYYFNGNAYTQSGLYFDTLNTLACDSIVALKLHVNAAPFAYILASPMVVNPGGMVEFTASKADNYLWQTSVQINSDKTTQHFNAIFYASNWVYVTVSNSGNTCFATDSIYISVRTDTVIVAPCGPNTYIFLPNAFVPGSINGNGIFRIKSSNIRLQQFHIFNKWGNSVFSTSNIFEGWNGMYKGSITPGNYVYRVAYFDCNPNVIKVKTGNVLLLK